MPMDHWMTTIGPLSPAIPFIIPTTAPGTTTEKRLTSPTGGRKGSKLERFDLLPVEPLTALARHYGVGAEKYTERDDAGNVIHDGANNWRLGYNWSLSFASLMRHAFAFWSGEDIDEETGTPHIVAAAWHCFALAWFMQHQQDYDDRSSTLKERELKEDNAA